MLQLTFNCSLPAGDLCVGAGALGAAHLGAAHGVGRAALLAGLQRAAGDAGQPGEGGEFAWARRRQEEGRVEQE